MQGMTLRQGDCLELMRDIPDDSVDMIFSAPPYGTTTCDWDVPIDWAAWWKEARRITKKNAPILLFSQMPFTLKETERCEFAALFLWQKDFPYKKDDTEVPSNIGQWITHRRPC